MCIVPTTATLVGDIFGVDRRLDGGGGGGVEGVREGREENWLCGGAESTMRGEKGRGRKSGGVVTCVGFGQNCAKFALPAPPRNNIEKNAINCCPI